MVFSPLTILMLAAMGLIGLLLARRTGFADIWDDRVSNRQRFLIPCIVGLIYGVVTIAPLISGASSRVHPLATGSDVHVKFPLSIPYYAYGAVFMEIFLRLFCIPLLVWLISNVILRGKWQTPVFWLAAILVAFYEPMPYMMEDFAGKTPLGSLYVVFSTPHKPALHLEPHSGIPLQKVRLSRSGCNALIPLPDMAPHLRRVDLISSVPTSPAGCLLKVIRVEPSAPPHHNRLHH